jgi:hypothetical protein
MGFAHGPELSHHGVARALPVVDGHGAAGQVRAVRRPGALRARPAEPQDAEGRRAALPLLAGNRDARVVPRVAAGPPACQQGPLPAAGAGYATSPACARPESAAAPWMPPSAMSGLASWQAGAAGDLRPRLATPARLSKGMIASRSSAHAVTGSLLSSRMAPSQGRGWRRRPRSAGAGGARPCGRGRTSVSFPTRTSGTSRARRRRGTPRRARPRACGASRTAPPAIPSRVPGPASEKARRHRPGACWAPGARAVFHALAWWSSPPTIAFSCDG